MKQAHTSKKILLVDHDDSIREIFRSVLESSGYQVVTARSREEALKKVDKKLPDLIISEAELPPEKSGFHFYKHLKAEVATTNIPFIFLTSIDTKIIQKLLKAGDLHIEKPIKSQLFLEEVDKFVKKRLQSPVAKKTQKIKKVEKSIIKILDFQTDKLPKPERKKNVGYPIMPLPPGHSTKFFCVPAGVFDLKNVRSCIIKATKKFKTGVLDIKEEEMLFPFLPDDAPTQRLVPVNMPERSVEVVSEEEVMMVDLDINEKDIIALEEFSQEITEVDTSEGLREAFFQYFDKRASDFQLDVFDNLLVIDNANSVLYSDFSDDIDPEAIFSTWENFLHSMRSLLLGLNITGETSYLWIETVDDQAICIVNAPEKDIIPFMQIQECPAMEVLFNEENLGNESFEKIENETFFLLPHLTSDIPLISKNKIKELLVSLQVNFIPFLDTKIVIQNSEDGTLVATTCEKQSFEAIFSFTHNIFSVAGLCSQICEMGFDLDYVIVETESNSTVLVNDINKGIYISCLTEKISF